MLTTAGHDAAAAWAAEHLAGLPVEGVRVAPPRQAGDGRWVVDGWVAHEYLPGRPDTSRWPEILAAGAALHAAWAHLPRPPWAGRGDDPWTRAGRFAWGEAGLDLTADAAALVAPLLAARRPVAAPDQVGHGDLTGNVLFAPRHLPAVIDLTLVWRPAGYAAAIVAVDCYEWEGAGEEIMEQVAASPEGGQLLLRAALFRAARQALDDHGRPRPIPGEVAAVVSRTIDWVLARA